MATFKQVQFAMRLMAERDAGELRNTPEYQAVSCGMGEELPTTRMSRFIDDLLACPRKVREPMPPKPRWASKAQVEELLRAYQSGALTVSDKDRVYLEQLAAGAAKVTSTFAADLLAQVRR